MLLNELLNTKCVFNAGIHAYEVFLNIHWYGDIMDTRVIDCSKTRHIITSCASLIINRKTKQIYLFRLKSKTLMSNIGNVHVA